MTALATDNFNRADNADLGASWDVVPPIGAFKIVGNQVVPTAAGTNAFESNNSVTWPDDQYSEARLTTSSTSTSVGPGILVRASASALTCYALSMSHAASLNVRLLKYVAGTPTGLTNTTQAWTDGDLVRLEAQGTTLRIFINGSQVGSDATDSSIASGRPGICYNSNATSTIDDWAGGDFASGGTSIVPTIGAGLLAGVAPTRVLGTVLEPVMP